MRIEDFADMEKFEEIMSNWAGATGLATVAVGADGNYISKCYNFTDFCINLTRGSKEGMKRCVKCDQEGHGVYTCHAGLVDFGIDLVVNGEKLGSVIGGQVLPEKPDEEYFRSVAREIGVDEDRYVAALNKVNIRSRDTINASAGLLGDVLNSFINAEYNTKHSGKIIEKLTKGAEECEKMVSLIQTKTKQLDSIQLRQRILSINANIEAAHAGSAGRGFAVVAEEVGALSENCSELNSEINGLVNEISKTVKNMTNI